MKCGSEHFVPLIYLSTGRKSLLHYFRTFFWAVCYEDFSMCIVRAVIELRKELAAQKKSEYKRLTAELENVASGEINFHRSEVGSIRQPRLSKPAILEKNSTIGKRNFVPKLTNSKTRKLKSSSRKSSERSEVIISMYRRLQFCRYSKLCRTISKRQKYRCQKKTIQFQSRLRKN